MAENIHMYYEKKTDKNVNMRQKAKLVILKTILKRLNLKMIEKD